MNDKRANGHQRTHFCLHFFFFCFGSCCYHISPLKINFLLAFTCNFYQGLVHSSNALPTSYDSNEIHHVLPLPSQGLEPSLSLCFGSQDPLSLRLHFPLSARPFSFLSVCCTEFHSLPPVSISPHPFPSAFKL